MKTIQLSKFIGIALSIAMILASSTQLSFADVTGDANEISESENEIESVNPVIGKFEKYTPCNEIIIPMDKLSKELIVGKLTGKHTKQSTVIVWTKDELNESDKDAARKAIINVPGIGNPKIYEFHNGSYVSLPNYGLTVNAADAKILLDDPSCWALFAGATFQKVNDTNNGILDEGPTIAEPDTPEEAPPASEDNQPEIDIPPVSDVDTPTGTDDILKETDSGDNEPVIINPNGIPIDIDENDETSEGIIETFEDNANTPKDKSNKNGTVIKPASVNSEVSTVPQTGDTENLIIYLGIIAAATCLLSLLMFKRDTN